MDNSCHICGKENIRCEIHHIIFRSQSSYMRTIKINLISLCVDCHRGNNSPHQDKRLDLQLKVKLQFKLQEMFSEKWYSGEQIQEILQCTDFDLVLILKKMCLYRFGYNAEQLVLRLMGGRLYG